jgi:hypothetical protein
MKTYWGVEVSGPLHVFAPLPLGKEPLESIIQEEAWWASTRLDALEKTMICHCCLLYSPPSYAQ